MMVALVVVVVVVQISPSGAKERGVPSQEEERVNKQGERKEKKIALVNVIK